MHFLHFVIIGQIVVSFLFEYSSGFGVDSLCSCVNPVGVCSLLCAPHTYNDSVLVNRTPAYGMIRPRGVPQPYPRKRLVYLERPMENAFGIGRESSACTTATEISYSTIYKTKIRHTLRVVTKLGTVTKSVPVTVEKIKKITLTPETVVKTLIETDTIRITTTETRTRTLPVVTQPITYKSIRVLTPEPMTKTKQVRVPPSIFIKTSTVTTTLPPASPVIVTCTQTAKITVTETAEPTLYKDYVNIKPLLNTEGILIEFHDSNNKVKTVNVIMPLQTKNMSQPVGTERLFSNGLKRAEEEQVTITVQKNLTKNLPRTVTETEYITKRNPIFITKIDYVTKTDVATHTRIKYLTKTKNKIVTEISPETQTKISIVPTKKTVVEVSTLLVEKPVLITQTKTVTVRKTVPTTVYSTQTETQTQVSERTRTIQTNKIVTLTQTATKSITTEKYVIKPTTITKISPKYVTLVKTATETATATITKTTYSTITSVQKPLPTVDRSKQYTGIISDLRRKIEEYRRIVDIADQTNNAYRTEVSSLRALLNKH